MKRLFIIMLAALTLAGCDDKEKPVKTYTVTFDAAGGSPKPPKQTVEAGEQATAPAENPTKQGYVFLFWSLDNVATAYDFSKPVNSNITLVAQWQDETTVEYWQVTWNLNGGSWSAADNHATKVVKGGALTEPAEPVKAGNVFDGWYKEAALTNKVNFPYDVSGATTNITLYAKWKVDTSIEYWQVTWVLNDGAWPVSDNHVTQMVKGDAIAIHNMPVKADNVFDGWYKEAAFTNKITFPYNVTANTTLYAKWSVITNQEQTAMPSVVNNVALQKNPTFTLSSIPPAGTWRVYYYGYTADTFTDGTYKEYSNHPLYGATVTQSGTSLTLARSGFSFVSTTIDYFITFTEIGKTESEPIAVFVAPKADVLPVYIYGWGNGSIYTIVQSYITGGSPRYDINKNAPENVCWLPLGDYRFYIGYSSSRITGLYYNVNFTVYADKITRVIILKGVEYLDM